ncbi:MAG TPA: phosphoribosylaminoimidazolesuccinocarboxamide synthase [Candidatus Xenobia bacterium]|nr:phosphoribosylaminoimidazolesuccinocarboxamide synthase [Candidatus Xenobia bacterium]
MAVTVRTPLLETHLAGMAPISRGKVRDLYEVGDNLLIVATDRISAFDCILASGIPDKGRVLNQLSIFWFDLLKDVVETHFITARLEDYPAGLHAYGEQLEGRSMLVRRTRPVPIECVARGYLSGSGWKEYKQTGAVCGIRLPAGLRESDQLPEPIFTPATKATTGHDINISFEETAAQIGGPLAGYLRDLTLEIYRRASEYARSRGIIIADTKFEFGLLGERVLLIDEVLTPDSSRFWAVDAYTPGQPQPSFDKQFVRDYLEQSGWNKQPPAPALPPDIVEATRQRYREAYRRLTGRELD